MKKTIKSQWTQTYARWSNKLKTYTDRSEDHYTKDIEVEIFMPADGKPRVHFRGGPTGYESYYLSTLQEPRPKPCRGEDLCICGGTINSWPRCMVKWADVRDLINAYVTFNALKEKALPLIAVYHSDLLVHDLNTITNAMGVPFLHFTGITGTYIVMLTPAAQLPARYEKVPYLFSEVTVERSVSDTVDFVQCMAKLDRQDCILYYAGADAPLREIDQAEAEVIAQAYVTKTFREWEAN